MIKKLLFALLTCSCVLLNGSLTKAGNLTISDGAILTLAEDSALDMYCGNITINSLGLQNEASLSIAGSINRAGIITDNVNGLDTAPIIDSVSYSGNIIYCSEATGLEYVISVLQLVNGKSIYMTLNDINNDGQTGLAEAIAKLSELSNPVTD